MMYITKKTYKGGQVMLTIVILFLFLSTTIVLGIANPILKQVRIAQDNLKSKGSYYAAESAIEDVFYRLQANKQVAASETVTVNNAQATIVTTNTLAGKQLTAIGNLGDTFRKLQTSLARGDGVVFRYGTQSGLGGMIIDNNSLLTGTLYSNGNIVGSNGAQITGDAFVAGATGSINLVEIGGDARAHTITNSKVTGNLYCQTGSGNKNAGGGTISCNTSQSDLPIIDLPISDAEIADWETDAAAGGTITGNTTISSPTTMGPKKIVGDLIINDMLTLNNTLWVTGHIIISGNGAGIKLAPSYLASSGVIISDGYIDISNNVTFQDSGTAGSYILLLSNSTCDASTCSGNNAIDVGNNSSIIIANAEKGTVYFSNVSGVKEAVGRTIHLKNNSSITYGSGLIDVNFTSGPTGGYNVVDWGEIQ